MTRRFFIAAYALALVWPAGASAGAGDASRGYLVDGALEMVVKYDSNTELARRSKVDDLAEDYVHSPEARLSLNHSLGTSGWLAAELSSLANWHVEHRRRDWYFGTGKFALDYNLGKGELDFSNAFSSYVVPRKDRFAKHKETLFYERRLTERLSWSSYQELIFKDLSKRDDPRTGRLNRHDTLLLASTFFKFKLGSSWFLETRYLMRMRHSTAETEEYENHLAFLSLEYRF